MPAVSVDVGTTVVKAVGYDDGGREALVARQGVPVQRRRPGWAEQDMAAVWDAVAATVREVVDRLDGATVDHLSLTAQGDGAWLVDDHGAPTGPALLWNDGRAALRCRRRRVLMAAPPLTARCDALAVGPGVGEASKDGGPRGAFASSGRRLRRDGAPWGCE